MIERIGLIATARKKASHPAPVTDFYRSPLFKRTLEYASRHYDRNYFYNIHDGFLLPDDIMVPNAFFAKSVMTRAEKRKWAEKVVSDLLQFEAPQYVTLYLHGGNVYREFLEPELEARGFSFVVPLKGYSIGEQLNWYKEKLG